MKKQCPICSKVFDTEIEFINHGYWCEPDEINNETIYLNADSIKVIEFKDLTRGQQNAYIDKCISDFDIKVELREKVTDMITRCNPSIEVVTVGAAEYICTHISSVAEVIFIPDQL